MRSDSISENRGRRNAGALYFSLAALIVHVSMVLAQAGDHLSVTPTRVVFDGRTRSAQILLINQGTAAQTYRISLIRMRMTEDGRIEEITDPEPPAASADPLLRYAPRQVSLEPGVAQTVRLLLRKPADLAAGEYRSHLLLRAVPPQDAGHSIESLQTGERQIGFQLTPIYGVSIPVIVRHGDLPAAVALADPELLAADGEVPRTLSLRLERRGERSVYGDLTVTWIPSGGGLGIVVREVKGVAVYTPNPSRTLRLTLPPPAGVELRSGRLEVRFAERPETPGAVWAEARVSPS